MYMLGILQHDSAQKGRRASSQGPYHKFMLPTKTLLQSHRAGEKLFWHMSTGATAKWIHFEPLLHEICPSIRLFACSM
jgi:hypothetical protein